MGGVDEDRSVPNFVSRCRTNFLHEVTGALAVAGKVTNDDHRMVYCRKVCGLLFRNLCGPNLSREFDIKEAERENVSRLTMIGNLAISTSRIQSDAYNDPDLRDMQKETAKEFYQECCRMLDEAVPLYEQLHEMAG